MEESSKPTPKYIENSGFWLLASKNKLNVKNTYRNGATLSPTLLNHLALFPRSTCPAATLIQ